MRCHTDNKPHQCKHCHRKFARPIHLSNHLRVHTGEKPHKCDTCGQKFAEKRYLERHQYVHLGVKPFMCHLCSYTCVKKDTLKNHIRGSHGETALPEDMKTKRKKMIRLHELPEDEQLKLVGFTVTSTPKARELPTEEAKQELQSTVEISQDHPTTSEENAEEKQESLKIEPLPVEQLLTQGPSNDDCELKELLARQGCYEQPEYAQRVSYETINDRALYTIAVQGQIHTEAQGQLHSVNPETATMYWSRDMYS